MNGIRLTLGQIKAIELDILISFANFCECHGLHYYLAYGTLLGAVRHGGFIPWDDDIDVVMLREDYERLNKLLKDNIIRKDLDWITLENGKWNEPYGKIINTNTALTAEGMKTSIWIDVFPLDNYNKIVLKKNILWRSIHIAKNTTIFSFDVKSIMKFILKYTFCWKSFDSISQDICNRIKRVSNSNIVAQMVWPGRSEPFFDKQFFEGQSEIIFEGVRFKTVKDVDGYLRLNYGEYMQLPPENERKNHHIVAYWIGPNSCPF